jgi:thiol:disulfide interchange protein DsbD
MPRIHLQRVVIFLLALFISAPVSAQSGNPPPADQVFSLTASRSTEGGLQFGWSIAPGNYLYRDKIVVKTATGAAVAVSAPSGQIKDDPTFGTTEIYHDHVQAEVAGRNLPTAGQVVVIYQGCAERGICYPPIRKSIDLATLAVMSGAKADLLNDIEVAVPSESRMGSQANIASSDEIASAATRLLSGRILGMLAAFFGFGLLLSFTPCVFPMMPILSGMLARSGEHLSAWRGFALSGAYVLAMGLAYAALGIAAAWSGQNLQVALQTPIALGVISLVFVALERGIGDAVAVQNLCRPDQTSRRRD